MPGEGQAAEQALKQAAGAAGALSTSEWAKRLMATAALQGALIAGAIYLLARVVREEKSEGLIPIRVAGKLLKLTGSEQGLLDCVIDADDIDEDFDAVGGLQDVKAVVQRSVVLPFQHPHLYPPKSLRAPPKGVLLYGAPGTGKTLVAKALARSCKAAFIEVRVESLFGKWLGQSEQAVAAIFSLARKLQPSVIFVDELDSLLSRRSHDDQHAYANAKTIFLRHWDGFATSESQHRVVVVGATNRPAALDSAVLRRLPVKLYLPPPQSAARLEILRILLRGEDLTGVDLEWVAARTERYSGSDLRELCKQALLIVSQRAVEAGRSGGAEASPRLAALDRACFLAALEVVGPNSDFSANASGAFGGPPAAPPRGAPGELGSEPTLSPRSALPSD
eukprot:TRINITY_DN20910_c0_g1_i1.p1 TRINITY_DN20910_c0_g1~~TRINITY_DN20910_c0_g1_i1.p1  ORF type:complete len:393 (+),score=136.04 TRINITY_DN20910_c0_g1_i1:92-1270(+)